MWNSAPRQSRVVNSNQLTATIFSNDIAAPGTATVSVANGSFWARPVTFTITPNNPTVPPVPTPIAITTSSLPGATVSSAYSATLAARGGTPPYAWRVVSGQLPAGLALSSTGVISGTPSASGNFFFTPQVRDSASSPQAATQSESITVAANPSPTTYFGTEPSHATYLPRSDAYCASAVVPNSREPRPDNYQANHTVVLPPHGWSNEDYWTRWRDKRAQVTGDFTGATTEIIQWAACKWGIDEDTIRADAVQESYWHMSTMGDVCGPQGEASYGLLQIKNQDCSGTVIHGGYPHTQQSTALNADWYAAHIRSCYDGDFYDGGNWLYDGQTVDQIAAQHGWSYVFWACVGFHFSGDWSPGQPYELQVRQHLAKRTWESPNF